MWGGELEEHYAFIFKGQMSAYLLSFVAVTVSLTEKYAEYNV